LKAWAVKAMIGSLIFFITNLFESFFPSHDRYLDIHQDAVKDIIQYSSYLIGTSQSNCIIFTQFSR